MKLQDLLIGIGLFALFTIIIFGFISNQGGDCAGLYCENYLNVTHDDETAETISDINLTSYQTEADFNVIRGDLENFTGDEPNPDEANVIGGALKTVMNIPKAWIPLKNVLKIMQTKFNIPKQFTQWFLGSIVIIMVLMFIGSFLKNKLQS